MAFLNCSWQTLLHVVLWTFLFLDCSILCFYVLVPPTEIKEVFFYMLVYTGFAWPALLLTSGKLVTKAALLLVIVGYIHQWRLKSVSRDFHVHCYIGLMLLYAGASIAKSRGPLTLDATLGAFGLSAVLLGFVVQVQTTVLGKTIVPMHAKHLVYYWQVGGFIFGASLQSFLESRHPSSSIAIARLTEIRWLLDPASFAGMGVGFYFHAHDRRIVGIIFHEWLGLMFLMIAATYLLKGFASLRFSYDSRVFRLTSMLAAFSFVLGGAWMVRMGTFLYVYDSRSTGRLGLHHIIWKEEHVNDEAGAFEACSLYLGIDIMLSAVAVSSLAYFRDDLGKSEYAVLHEGGDGISKDFSGHSLDDNGSKEMQWTMDKAMVIDIPTETCAVIGAIQPALALEKNEPAIRT